MLQTISTLQPVLDATNGRLRYKRSWSYPTVGECHGNAHCPAAFNLLQLTRFVITARCPRAEDCRHGVFAERHVRTMERSGWFVLR